MPGRVGYVGQIALHKAHLLEITHVAQETTENIVGNKERRRAFDLHAP